MDAPGFTASLVAGGVAGASVDLILFPLDTIKTRLQSPQGFSKAGGFRGIYAGVPSTIASFPNAAMFFLTYEYVKCLLHTDSASHFRPMKHMLAASVGEVVACLIRVPSEVVKQRAQVSASSKTLQIFFYHLKGRDPFLLGPVSLVGILESNLEKIPSAESNNQPSLSFDTFPSAAAILRNIWQLFTTFSAATSSGGFTWENLHHSTWVQEGFL